MNLVWFLTIGTIISLVLGEFGQFPFASPNSVSLTDIFLSLTITFLLIWQIGIKKKILLPFPLKLLFLFWIVGFTSLLFSGNLHGGLYLVRFILYSSSFWLGYLLVKEKKTNLDFLFQLIILVGIIISNLGFFQIMLYPDLKYLSDLGYDPHLNRLVSTFLDPNFTGSILNISFLFSVYFFLKDRKRKWLFIGSFILVAIILTFSRSAYLMLFSEIFILGILKERKILVMLVIIFIIFYLAIPRFATRINGAFNLDITASERLLSWQTGVTIFQNNPILGVGFNNIREAYKEYNLVKVFTPNGGNAGGGLDSSLLLVLATTGVVGFVAYLSFFGVVIKKFLTKYLERKELLYLIILSLIIGIFINSQFINSLFFPPIMFILFLIMGAIYEND